MYKKIILLAAVLAPQIAKAAVSLENPLRAQSIPELVNSIIRALLGVVGALSLFYFVWGGIVWMTSGGNADRVRKGKDTLVWATFGLAIIFFAYTLVNLIFTSLGTSG